MRLRDSGMFAAMNDELTHEKAPASGARMREVAVSFPSVDVEVHGVLRIPEGAGAHPAVVLIHGSLEQDRDGNMLQDPEGRAVPPHPFLREIGVHLTAAGFAALSWDKRGFGESGTDPGTYWDQAADAAAALDLLEQRDDIDARRRFVFGQSAGVFVASILAGHDDRPRAYVLSGGLGTSFTHNVRAHAQRIRRYAAVSDAHRRWVQDHSPRSLVIADNLERLLAAVAAGADRIELRGADSVIDYAIDQRTWDETVHPRMVRNVRAPALVIHGGADLNVPVDDAELLVAALREAGNRHVEHVIIDGVDHSFQQVASDEDERLRERLTYDCFRRPYQQGYFDAVVGFLRRWS